MTSRPRRPYVVPQVRIVCRGCGAIHLDWFAGGCRRCGRPLSKPQQLKGKR